MKNYLGLLFGATLIFISCDEHDGSNINELSILTTLKGESGLSYSESLNRWNELKAINGNSYTYQTTFQSWVGFGSTTELRVVDGKVTTRVYQGFNTNVQTGEREITDSYTENGTSLGNHENGALPLTIDELYNSCVSDFLVVDKKNNTLYFETDINGLMTLCGFIPNNCADDCYQGISLSSFDWID